MPAWNFNNEGPILLIVLVFLFYKLFYMIKR